MNRIICADAIDGLRQLDDDSVQAVVTSPPYWGLRDYGVPGQMGLEPTVREYVSKMVEVFDEVRRVLRPDGALWLNIGDTWFGGSRGGSRGADSLWRENRDQSRAAREKHMKHVEPDGLKRKDMVLLPARTALAMQESGWWVRSEVIWHKPNPMPESARDRPTHAHEHIYLLTKGARYFWNREVMREPVSGNAHARGKKGEASINPKAVKVPAGWDTNPGRHDGIPPGRSRQNDSFQSSMRHIANATTRNVRSVWKIGSQGFKGAHYAVFPEDLVTRCLTATSRPGDLVLDPFLGSGTVALVAAKMGRRYVGIDVSQEYIDMARKRITDAMPMFADTEVA